MVALGPVGRRLEAAGVDIGFLAWLAGPDARLPYIDRVGRVATEDFARAIRAVSWLAGLRFEPEIVAAGNAQAWGDRYSRLDTFLHGALLYSMVAHRNERHVDLEALERVLQLLPESSTVQFRKDIQHLRKLGEPKRPEFYTPEAPVSKRRSGGALVREETGRMRAAIEYLKSLGVSDPYEALAELWTEIEVQKHGKKGKEYHADSIRSRLRLRKSQRDLDGEGYILLEFWRAVYDGDLRIAFLARFPLSTELNELLLERQALRITTTSRPPRRSSRLPI